MKFHVCLLALAVMANSCSAKKSDKKTEDDRAVNQLSSEDFKAQFDMKPESTLLMADSHSDAAVKAVIHLQNAGDDVRISFSDAADACIFETREEEPYDKSRFSLIVYQSYYAYTFQDPSLRCERTIVIERVSDGLTLSKDLQFTFADLAPADDGLEEDDWDNGGGFDPDDAPGNGGRTPRTPTTGGTMKMCVGVATACGMRFNMASCWSGGCYWSSMTNSCSGYVTPCHVNYTQSSCNSASGCMWQ